MLWAVRPHRCKVSLAGPSFRRMLRYSRMLCVLRGVIRMVDLQARLNKYESKAVQCEERVRQATDGPQRAFFEVLARYYGELATDFRQVIEKRKAA